MDQESRSEVPHAYEGTEFAKVWPFNVEIGPRVVQLEGEKQGFSYRDQQTSTKRVVVAV